MIKIISKRSSLKKGKVKCSKSTVFLASFWLNSCFYPVFEILITEGNVRVLKQCAIFNKMYAIKQFKKYAIFFLL